MNGQMDKKLDLRTMGLPDDDEVEVLRAARNRVALRRVSAIEERLRVYQDRVGDADRARHPAG